MDIGVHPTLIKWVAIYLQEKSQMCTSKISSPLQRIRGGIPQGSKLGSIAFIIKINQLPRVVGSHSDRRKVGSDKINTVMFMDNTTASEVIN